MDKYQIVYNGVMLAMEEAEVRAAFAQLFRISSARAAEILATPKTVLRNNLDAASAETYREKLAAIGLDVDVVCINRKSAGLLATAQASQPVDVDVVPEKTPLSLEPYAPGDVRRNEIEVVQAVAYKGNRALPFVFNGTGLDYFPVWIVNVLLTVLTLGIYSAWAKVRTQQFFYGHTQLDGTPFAYLASPTDILRGRVMAVVLLLFYVAAQGISPTTSVLALWVLLAFLPALVVLAFSARLRFSAWREVSLDFARDFSGAYRVFGLPVVLFGLVTGAGSWVGHGSTTGMLPASGGGIVGLAMLVLFCGFPFWQYQFNRFVVEHAAYGNQGFGFAARVRDYYKLYFLQAPALLLLVILVAGGMAAVVGVSQFGYFINALKNMHLQAQVNTIQSLGAMVYAVLVLLVLVLFIGCGLVIAYLRASLFNLRYNGLSVGKSVLACRIRALPLLWLYASNALLVAVTGGLFFPWAKVRLLRYRISCLTLYASYELEDIVSEAQSA